MISNDFFFSCIFTNEGKLLPVRELNIVNFNNIINVFIHLILFELPGKPRNISLQSMFLNSIKSKCWVMLCHNCLTRSQSKNKCGYVSFSCWQKEQRSFTTKPNFRRGSFVYTAPCNSINWNSLCFQISVILLGRTNNSLTSLTVNHIYYIHPLSVAYRTLVNFQLDIDIFSSILLSENLIPDHRSLRLY